MHRQLFFETLVCKSLNLLEYVLIFIMVHKLLLKSIKHRLKKTYFCQLANIYWTVYFLAFLIGIVSLLMVVLCLPLSGVVKPIYSPLSLPNYHSTLRQASERKKENETLLTKNATFKILISFFDVNYMSYNHSQSILKPRDFQ